MAGENYINHIALVLDASGSMDQHHQNLVRIADGLVKHLAEQSNRMDQETRVTIYSFDEMVRCLVYEKDVLRLPSIATLYQIGGMTALVDASLLAVEDLDMQPQKYGDHAFLAYVLTDGAENASRHTPAHFKARLARIRDDNWTIAALVPNSRGESFAKAVGFPPGNIAIWDASSAAGLEDSFVRIRTATDSFMGQRTAGVRSTQNLFDTSASSINKATIKQANLKPLKNGAYLLLDVNGAAPDYAIRPFVQNAGHAYTIGKAFYQLSKTETIQSQKDLAIVRKKDGKVFYGSPEEVRSMVGLPVAQTVRVKPSDNPEFDFFVQSTSVNRKLVPGTKLLLLQ